MHENIHAALSAFQGEMSTVKKAETATVPMKSGGKYSYTYATLADVQAVVMPLLAKHGLSFTVRPASENGAGKIIGELWHESGGCHTGELPLFGNSPQDLGSSLTYARRYLLGCLTGVATDDDDDAASAQGSRRTEYAPKREPEKKPRAVPPGGATDDDLTRLVKAVKSIGGMDSKTAVLDWVNTQLSREIKSSYDLTHGEVTSLIEIIEGPESA